ncbi:integrase, catalytic region, zinc finger, CCHC-type containing protein [Tanacetum coccineum]|uniref:Integrase, catalytic region, zinc finger, CCHC-type containing protein n=1 Tax=Tanacetum coccineum TaxID=301880 RepID=A0ABQ5A7W6_9ASTR
MLMRYKERVKTFEQRLNIDLSSREKLIDSQMDDMIRDRNALKQEIDLLKQTLSKHVKEKKSLLQTFTALKKESKEKENKYIDKEIDLENKINELDNIVYKVGQSAQTMHMKAQRIKTTLYDGCVISKKHDVISMVDEEETLILEEESRSKMFEKQNDLISKEKKINISPINYSELNKLSKDFGKPEIEVPKELPKVYKEEVIPFIISLRESFKDFENGLHSELNEVKTVFNQMEAAVEQCYVDKKYFDIQKKEFSLDNDLLLDYIIYQDVMNIVMHVDSVPVNVLPANNKCLVNDNIEIKRLEQENDNIFELLLSQDIVHICVNYLASHNDCREMQHSFINEYNENLVLKAKLAKKEHMVEKIFFDEVVLRCSRLQSCGANLDLKLQHQKESLLNNRSLNNQNAPEIMEFLKINEWKAKLDAKDVLIANLRKHIESLKGKNVVEKDVQPKNPNVIAPGMFKLDLEPLAPKVLKNMDAHIDYIKHSREHADTLREIVKHARALKPLDRDLNSACMYVQRIQEVLVYVAHTCPSLTQPSEKLVALTPLNKNNKVRFTKPAASSRMKSSTSASRSQPLDNTKNNRISQTTSSYPKNKVEDHPRSVKSNSNKRIVLLNLFGNDQIAKIMVYGDYQMGNVTISWVYYVEGLGKSKKHSHKPKAEDPIQEKLYLLHMDLYGPMRIQSINGRKYILVIVDDYSRFTWVKFLRSKDEVPEFVIKFLKMIQVCLNTTVQNIRTNNGTEFVNKTLRA